MLHKCFIFENDCPFGKPSNVLWLCQKHKELVEKWEQKIILSEDAIEDGKNITKDAWETYHKYQQKQKM